MADKKYQHTPEELAAASLQADERIARAKKLLHEAIEDQNHRFSGIRPPIEGLRQNYDAMLAEIGKLRGGPLWFPYLGSGIGKGALVELADGSVKYDFICGIGPHYFGHNHPKILDALIDAAISNTVMQGNLQQNTDSLELLSLFVEHSGLDHCFLSTSGAMANENAIKIAFQKHYPAYRVLAFQHCFAGRSLMLSQVTDKAAYREGLPINSFVDYIPFFDPKDPAGSTARAVAALNAAIARYPKSHAIMCFELIQGEGGFYPGTRDFFKAIMEILKKNDIAVFADEVQSFGRTSELFAYQYYGLQEYIDIATTGKLSQVCATLFTDAYTPKPGLISQTFTASTSAIKAAVVIFQDLISGGYFGPQGRIAKLHDYFEGKLKALSEKYPDLIQGPFGIGCMVAFTVYGGAANETLHFIHRLFDAGVISFIAGSNPSRVRFLVPAGVVTEEDIDNVVAIVERTLVSKP